VGTHYRACRVRRSGINERRGSSALLHRYEFADRCMGGTLSNRPLSKLLEAVRGCDRRRQSTAPAPVLDETERKSKELHDWLADRDGLFVDLDEAVQLEVKEILAKHPKLVMEKKQRYAADPFVIALAKLNGLVVVTDEKPTGTLNRPNIPDVPGRWWIWQSAGRA
jgi:Domain of unknown function (DUF4411)